MRLSARAVNEALLLEALGFIFVALLIWVNEYLDLPHMLLGAPATPWRPVEVAIEAGFVLLLGAAVTGVSWLTFRRLAYLESLLILCASCQRVGDEGHWMDFETFMQSRDRTGTTHGMCPKCQAMLAEFAEEPTAVAEPVEESNPLEEFAEEPK